MHPVHALSGQEAYESHHRERSSTAPKAGPSSRDGREPVRQERDREGPPRQQLPNSKFSVIQDTPSHGIEAQVTPARKDQVVQATAIPSNPVFTIKGLPDSYLDKPVPEVWESNVPVPTFVKPVPSREPNVKPEDLKQVQVNQLHLNLQRKLEEKKKAEEEKKRLEEEERKRKEEEEQKPDIEAYKSLRTVLYKMV